MKKYGLEDPSNLFVSQSYVGRAGHVKRAVKRARGRMNIEKDHYAHYFLVLQEGTPVVWHKEDVMKRHTKYLHEVEKVKLFPKTIKNSLATW